MERGCSSPIDAFPAKLDDMSGEYDMGAALEYCVPVVGGLDKGAMKSSGAYEDAEDDAREGTDEARRMARGLVFSSLLDSLRLGDLFWSIFSAAIWETPFVRKAEEGEVVEEGEDDSSWIRVVGVDLALVLLPDATDCRSSRGWNAGLKEARAFATAGSLR